MSPLGNRGATDLAHALESGTAGSLPGVALAARLRTVGAGLEGAVAPRPEFRDALRTRLMAVATVQAASLEAAVEAAVEAPAAPLVSAVSWRRRTGAVAAGAMASVVAVSGVAVAGSQSLPGDPFYGVKQTVEAFQLRTADGDVERGTQHLEFAATRLREVRALTLGRDAADAGPELGPSAMSGGITLRSASQPLASGDALSAPMAERVKQTLAAMDEQTREGTDLLTDAYRSSRATEPLRVLNRFATRQSAGLELLLPALPPRTQDRARISLALLDGVTEETGELLGIGTCAQGCDPTSTAPTLPTSPTSPTPEQSEAPCDCAAPSPAPAPQPTAPSTREPEPQVTDEPQPEPTPEPSASASPSPSPSPSGGLPLPPLPVPVPPLPVPVPTLTLAPVAPAVEPGMTGTFGGTSTSTRTSSGSGSAPADPAPAPAPQPVPQLAPVPTRS